MKMMSGESRDPNNNASTDQMMFKVALMGDFKVGKTSLIKKFVYNQFNDAYLMTMGTRISKKTLLLRSHAGGIRARLMIWDIMGQVKFANMLSSFTRGSAGGIFVCDMTRKSTYENVSKWINDFQMFCDNALIIIIGNKSDIGSHKVTEAEIAEMALKFNARYFITSAKTGENVERLFYSCAKTFVENTGRQDISDYDDIPIKEVQVQNDRKAQRRSQASEYEKNAQFDKAKEIYDELEMWDLSKKTAYLAKVQAAGIEVGGGPSDKLDMPEVKKIGFLTSEERSLLLDDRFLSGYIDKETYERLSNKYFKESVVSSGDNAKKGDAEHQYTLMDIINEQENANVSALTDEQRLQLLDDRLLLGYLSEEGYIELKKKYQKI
jgi:small GTP-binding protein